MGYILYAKAVKVHALAFAVLEQKHVQLAVRLLSLCTGCGGWLG